MYEDFFLQKIKKQKKKRRQRYVFFLYDNDHTQVILQNFVGCQKCQKNETKKNAKQYTKTYTDFSFNIETESRKEWNPTIN